MKHKQTKQLHATLRVLIVATLISACGVAPEAAISRLATQAAALLAPAAAPTQAYTVQPGDTLSGIAVTFGTTVDNVINLNADAYPQMTDRRTLMAGWTIQVPKGARVQSAAPNDWAAVAIAPAQPTPTAPVRDANGGYFDYDAALEIIRLTNEERAQADVGPLAIDEALMDIARKRAVEIVSNYGHAGLYAYCDPNVECGENITGGYANSDATWFVNRWVNSESHYRNMLASDWQRIGVSVYVFRGMSYAVQDFK